MKATFSHSTTVFLCGAISSISNVSSIIEHRSFFFLRKTFFLSGTIPILNCFEISFKNAMWPSLQQSEFLQRINLAAYILIGNLIPSQSEVADCITKACMVILLSLLAVIALLTFYCKALIKINQLILRQRLNNLPKVPKQ